MSSTPDGPSTPAWVPPGAEDPPPAGGWGTPPPPAPPTPGWGTPPPPTAPPPAPPGWSAPPAPPGPSAPPADGAPPWGAPGTAEPPPWYTSAPPPVAPPGPAPAPPSDGGRRTAVIAIAVAIVVIAAGASGYLLNHDRTSSSSKSTAGNSSAQPSGPPGTFAPITPTTAPDPSATALNGLVVAQADLPADITVQSLRGGNQVTGQTTLDLCNGTFPSEALRTARLQNAAVDSQGDVVLSTEAVLYKNGAATTQAFGELSSVSSKCPAAPVTSPVGEPTVITKFNPAPDSAWPQTATVDRQAYDFITVDPTTGQSAHSIAVYLKRGRALMGIYFADADTKPPTVGGQSTVAGIVGVFAARMAALPASVVNG